MSHDPENAKRPNVRWWEPVALLGLAIVVVTIIIAQIWMRV